LLSLVSRSIESSFLAATRALHGSTKLVGEGLAVRRCVRGTVAGSIGRVLVLDEIAEVESSVSRT
jgi:hypothetical protein